MTSTSIDILDEETCDFYYGSISRETAEYILWDKGCLDSMFLIRKSNSDYVLSLCYQKSILHYRISYLGNGEVMLHGLEAQKFSSIEHLLEGVEGLAIKPGLPCERSSGWQLPPTYWGLTVSEIRSSIIKKSHEWGFTEALVTFPIEYLSLGNDDYNRCILTEVTKSLINKTLHEIQPWFHGRLTRLEAEKSLDESGHKEGKFLVRERDESSYALCVSHEGTAKHYRIDILSSGELAIQDGHKFPSIMSLVSHYTVFTDGLWTSLGEPCPHLINPNQAYSTNGDLILQNTLRHNVVISANNVNNNQMIGVSGLTCRHNCPQQQQQQYQLHQHHAQQSCLVQPQSHQHQSANFYRSMSTERNRNLLNTQSRMRQPTSSIKLKDWLSNINHKWSQLISAVTPKNEPNETNRRAHHFSTLPRNHLNHHHHQHHNHSFNHSNSQSNRFNLNPQHFNVHQVLHSTQPHSNHHLINQQSIYDYAINGHQNSLNFRSLNVEINSPWINRNHNFLLNRVHSNGVNPNGHNEIVTESNHYHETDLFPKNFTSLNESKNGDNGDNCFNLTFSNQLIDNSKSLVNNLTTFIPSVEGKIAKSGSNNGTSGPYLVNGLIKSSSLEDVYSSSTLLISPFHEDEQAKNNVYLEKEENDADQVNNGDDDNDDKNKDKDNNINDNHLSSSSSSSCSSILMPPIPVPRKSKPLLGLVHPMVQYANHEIIKLYREPSKASKAESRRKDENDENDKDKSNDDSKCNEAPLTSLNDNECKVNENPSDLLLFDEILVNNGNNDKEDNLQRSCNQQIKTLIELITDGYFNQTFKGSHWPTTPNDIKVSNVINSSSTGNQSVDSTVISSTTSSAPFSSTLSSSSCDKKCLNTLYACKTVENSNSVCRPTESFSVAVSSEAPNEPVNNSEQSESSTLLSSKPVPMESNEVEKVENSIDSSCLVGLSGDRENSDNPNYEEINEELMKEIEATRPSIEVLREFDSCFHSSEADKRRASEPAICAATSLSSASTVPTNEGLYNRPELVKKANKRATLERSQTNATHWTSVDASGMIPMYDYDALKFDRDFIVKEASLGLSSLDPSQSGSQVKLNKLDLICLEEDPEEVNKSLTRYRQGPISLDPKFITLQKPLGNGYFGEVFLGTIPSSSGCASIQVAVKVLKLKAIPNHKSEILREAQTMSALDHKHIVRLIGVCEADPIMIVMELAPLGPLNQYLIDHGFGVTIKDIIALLLQVAMAMQYLESKQFIHRDLAARNVLLVNEKFAKVSDFGMSRALGIGKEYYKAKSASKWPLKWYAPECIYYFKFSTKSDVWSYGVTMWESLSYGQKPYEGMDGQDILRLFRENRRLPKPDNCPQEIYQLMWKCWQFRPEDRPTFAEICQTMTTYFLCSNI